MQSKLYTIWNSNPNSSNEIIKESCIHVDVVTGHNLFSSIRKNGEEDSFSFRIVFVFSFFTSKEYITYERCVAFLFLQKQNIKELSMLYE